MRYSSTVVTNPLYRFSNDTLECLIILILLKDSRPRILSAEYMEDHTTWANTRAVWHGARLFQNALRFQ